MNVVVWRRRRIVYRDGDIDIVHQATINDHSMGSVMERDGRYESSWEHADYGTLPEAKQGIRERAERLIPWAFARPQRRMLP